MHYQRKYRAGEIPRGTRARGAIHDRVHAHYKRGKKRECWLWLGHKNHNGYGTISAGAKGDGSVLAHRVAWESANKRQIPRGKVILHSCDIPACVNPNHLVLGTQADNMADMLEKKRGKGPPRVLFGERHHDARFTEADVRLIRASPDNFRALAKKYGVNPSSITKIRSRKTWKHID
jgi:hypothetical protein